MPNSTIQQTGALAAIAQASYHAYVDKNRSALEALLAEDFHFTSPLDTRLDRKTYFERCWPNSEKRFRNTEIMTIRDGKIHDVEVYFGWDIPHRVAEGKFVEA